jgi:tetratricopeptide (TPR) repeat protein
MLELKSGFLLAGRYTLRRRLGGSGDVAVWLAADRVTRTDVALKILVGDAARAPMLRREWQTLLRLMHPHIVRAFEYHESSDAASPSAYAMQFIGGPSLEVLARAEPADILPPMALVADALRYAHGKSIVHCDVKAANVLLDGHGAPYLIDFGVAAASGEQRGGGSLIAMSPQQLAGAPATPADDIFALGGLLYELLSGQSAYSSADTARDIRDRVAAPLTVPGVSPDIAELVAAMLAKDAAARPDAETVVERIRAAGFAPGPAPRRLVAGASAPADVVIESGDAYARRRQGAAAPAPVVAARRGLRPRTVGVLLTLLVAVLLGVIFLLPTLVRPPQPAEPVAGAPGQGTTAPAGDAADTAAPAQEAGSRAETEEVLGRLLAQVKTLEGRAVDRWGGTPWQEVRDAYAAGDEAYLAQDYAEATRNYEIALEKLKPLLGRVDTVFDSTLADARAALENGDADEAVRLFDLAVAITPGHAGAAAGLKRAQTLDRVLVLTEQGLTLERELALEAARDSFAQAVELDPEWKVAADGLARVRETIRQSEFDTRMSEGLNALAAGDYAAARAAFRMAQELDPASSEPADGLLQIDQATRLDDIAALEREAAALASTEQWDSAVETYERILELDSNLDFAQKGLATAEERVRLHERLDAYMANPDSLSADRTMQQATQLVVDITRMDDVGPRLAGQRDELARLLKRAATPLTVTLVSDAVTNVSVYKVGKLGAFAQTELELRPGTYVAVGSRPGYRDVRLEFRVAPEIEMEPVVVQCEEPI